MTPKLFAGTKATDEYTFMQTPSARDKLREHQRNFIREEDFKWMSNNGVNAVRIPVGYWVFDGDTPYVSCIGKLDWAFAMAEKYNIQVLISLHGAPGSQNGRDHSGRIGKAEWYKNPAAPEQTIGVLERLAHRYRDHVMFWGIELLNEPKAGLFQHKLRKFYNQAYKRLARIVLPSTRIVFHDAFTPRLLSAVIWDDSVHHPVMDIHWYHFAFGLRRFLPLWLYYRVVDRRKYLIRRLQRWQGIIIGEWNGIVDGKILDKYPKGEHDRVVREHIARQLRAYSVADGWFYWNYKTEARGVWHFRSMVEDGAIVLD